MATIDFYDRLLDNLNPEFPRSEYINIDEDFLNTPSNYDSIRTGRGNINTAMVEPTGYTAGNTSDIPNKAAWLGDEESSRILPSGKSSINQNYLMYQGSSPEQRNYMRESLDALINKNVTPLMDRNFIESVKYTRNTGTKNPIVVSYTDANGNPLPPELQPMFDKNNNPIPRYSTPMFYVGGEMPPTLNPDFGVTGNPDDYYLQTLGLNDPSQFNQDLYFQGINNPPSSEAGPVNIQPNADMSQSLDQLSSTENNSRTMTRPRDPLKGIAALNMGMGYLANMLNARQNDKYDRIHGLLQPAVTSLTQQQRYGSGMYMADGGEYDDYESDLDFINSLYAQETQPNTIEQEINKVDESNSELISDEEMMNYLPDVQNTKYKNRYDEVNNNTTTSTNDAVGFSSNYRDNNKNVSQKGVEYRDYLVSKGLSKEEASGIIGNLHAESSLKSNITNSIGAYGLAQWLGDRKKGLHTFAQKSGRDVGDPYTQLDYILHEFDNSEKSAFNSIKGKDLNAATLNIMNKYERPAEHEKKQSVNRRLGFAQQIYNMEMGGSVENNSYINNILKYK